MFGTPSHLLYADKQKKIKERQAESDSIQIELREASNKLETCYANLESLFNI
jgi:hypothetical protein